MSAITNEPGARGPGRGRLTEILEKTRPWIRMLAIGAFVVCGLLLLASASFLFLGVQGAMPLAGLGVLYLVIAIAYALPAVALFRYARELKSVEEEGTSLALEWALRVHRRFWLTAGIVGVIFVFAEIIWIGFFLVLPNLSDGMNRARAKRTIADIREIGQALERYATDHHRYPDVESLEELAGVLEPKYIRKIPRTDGWGHTLSYVGKCESGWCWDYRLRSPGSDGNPDFTDDATLWALSDPDDYRHRELRNRLGNNGSEGDPAGPVTLNTILERDVIYGSGLLLWAPEPFAREGVVP